MESYKQKRNVINLLRSRPPEDDEDDEEEG